MFIKKLKYRIFEPDLLKIENVRFIHHKPRHGNIGDNLCSPKHYIDCKAKDIVNIIGGGVFNDLAYQKVDMYNLIPERTVLWGIGQSVAGEKSPRTIEDTIYPYWGLRDIDSVSKAHFLPCISCLHPMLDVDINDSKTLLFLNFDKHITSHKLLDYLFELSYKNNFILLYNNCSEFEFKKALTQCDKIITNSFHGAYWGLLSGRKVSLLGYSSKFYSLYKMFDLDIQFIFRIQHGDATALLQGIENAVINSKFVHLEKYKEKRKEFISYHLNFIDNLQKSGLFNDINVKNGLIQT